MEPDAVGGLRAIPVVFGFQAQALIFTCFYQEKKTSKDGSLSQHRFAAKLCHVLNPMYT
jgi:hypothetical protein